MSIFSFIISFCLYPNFKAPLSVKYLVLKSFLNSTNTYILESNLLFSSLNFFFKQKYSFLLLLIPFLFNIAYNLLEISSDTFPPQKRSKNRKYLNIIKIGISFLISILLIELIIFLYE